MWCLHRESHQKIKESISNEIEKVYRDLKNNLMNMERTLAKYWLNTNEVETNVYIYMKRREETRMCIKIVKRKIEDMK